MACACSGFAIEVDERAKAMRFASDDCDHEWKAENSCTDEGLRCSADAEPDGQRLLQRTRKDTLAGERSSMLSGPMNMRVFAESKEKVKLLGKEIVVILELQPEQRKRFNERAAARNNL